MRPGARVDGGRSGGQPFDRSPEAPGPSPPTEVRVQELEGQMLEMQLEMQMLQDEVRNLSKAR